MIGGRGALDIGGNIATNAGVDVPENVDGTDVVDVDIGVVDAADVIVVFLLAVELIEKDDVAAAVVIVAGVVATTGVVVDGGFVVEPV